MNFFQHNLRIFFYSLVFLILTGNSVFCQNGIIRSFYEKGKPRYEISYADDHLEGTSYWYYPNGNLKEEKTYSLGILNGWVREYYASGLLKEEVYVENGVNDGAKKSYYENGGLREVATYENGILIKKVEVVFDPKFRAPVEAYKEGYRQKSNSAEQKEVLCNVEICPEPLGGYESIYNNLEYPEHAKLFGLEGTVTLVAIISESGDVIGTNVIKGLDLGCTQAALKAVELTRFLPGQNKGKIVQSQVTLDIEFKLERKPAVIIDIVDSSSQNLSDTLNTEKINEQKIDQSNCGIDECPKLKNGLFAFTQKIILPPVAKRINLEGEVVVEVEVDEFGFVRKTSIIKGIGYGCDEAVESALFSAEFIPGKLDGKEVYSTVILKIPVLQNVQND